MLKAAVKVFDFMVSLGAYLSGLIFLFMMASVCVDVVMRYWFQAPMGWVVEICEYLLLYVTFLAAAWLLRHHGHVRVDLVYHYLSDRSVARLKFITAIAGAVACAVLVVIGAQTTIDAYIRGNPEIKTLNLPKWTLLWVIPYGSLMLTLQFIGQVKEHWRQFQGKDQAESPGEVA